MRQFAAPHAGGVKGFQHGPVTQSERIGEPALSHDGFHLGDVEDVLGEPLFQTRIKGQTRVRPLVVPSVIAKTNNKTEKANPVILGL